MPNPASVSPVRLRRPVAIDKLVRRYRGTPAMPTVASPIGNRTQARNAAFSLVVSESRYPGCTTCWVENLAEVPGLVVTATDATNMTLSANANTLTIGQWPVIITAQNADGYSVKDVFLLTVT
jgi:hypothetical protein